MTTAAIITLIISTSLIQGVDPDLALRVAKVESNLNPKAIGTLGEVGVFQIMPYHAPKHLFMGPYMSLYDTKTNIKLGITLLKHALHKCSDMGQYAVICYNQGPRRRPKHPNKHPYYLKVSKA